ncbi:hypothetical protein ACFT25_39275, partial [Streptomyces hydrogenans]|uniref:hypothetical protein n=1 Tax=Streptomyces hydrogenans TaxID=1873719 RepID=UPI0036329B67
MKALHHPQQQRVLVSAGQTHRPDEGVQRAQGKRERVPGRDFGRVEQAEAGGGEATGRRDPVLEVVDAGAQLGEVSRVSIRPDSLNSHTEPAFTFTGRGCPVDRSTGRRAPGSA